MKAHISSENVTEIIKQSFTENIKKTQLAYTLAGAKAICKVVLEKANNEEQSAEERLKAITDFCETNLKGEI